MTWVSLHRKSSQAARHGAGTVAQNRSRPCRQSGGQAGPWAHFSQEITSNHVVGELGNILGG